MQSGALRALEFDRIVDAVTSFALTPMGAERLARTAPSTDPQVVAQLLAATSETARYLTANGTFPLRATEDLPQILVALAVEGRPLEPLRLLAFAAFLDSIDETRTAIRGSQGSQGSRGPFSILEATAGGAASFRGESAAVRGKIDPAGDVVDHASAELKVIRDKLRKQRTRLRTTLESYLRGKDTSKYLQDQVVTERNGRYVLVVRSEHRSSIPGIVHGASTSGASLFLEPLSTVEINNEIVALEEQEAEEIRRILLALTDAFRRRAGDMHRTLEAATELDVMQGRARYSISIDGVEPALSTDGAFELQAARHPLLIQGGLGSRGSASSQGAATSEGSAGSPGSAARSVVPVTIKVIPPSTVLLVTGPNTGGKTVALKTAGLLALMAQSGLRIPAADGSRVPVFRSIFADIGDEQSIEASLSTFPLTSRTSPRWIAPSPYQRSCCSTKWARALTRSKGVRSAWRSWITSSGAAQLSSLRAITTRSRPTPQQRTASRALRLASTRRRLRRPIGWSTERLDEAWRSRWRQGSGSTARLSRRRART